LRQLRLMESYLQRFMALDREQPLAAENVSLGEVVEDALSLVRPACVHGGIELHFHAPEKPLRVRGDPEALRQLTVNLAMNAVEAVGGHNNRARDCPNFRLGENGTVPFNARIIVALESTGDRRAALHIRDTGPGPSPEVADRLFEPFVTGKPEGTGLGLYVARQVAEGHSGSIYWRRDDNKTCFTVELPLA
jgi:signal transduction histidine kinase